MAFTRAPPGDTAPGLKRAAVAIALTEAEAGGGTAFLLTRRAATLRSHAAQWALPGGRCDAGETQAQAALRELHEELGVGLSEGDVLGLLDDYPTRSGYLVTPWWSGSAPAPIWCPTPRRSPRCIALRFTDIERSDAFSFTTIPESTRRVIRFRHEGQHIHAPTAALIYQFAEVLAGRNTRVAELEQPVFAWR